jgi:hypothetical protein
MQWAVLINQAEGALHQSAAFVVRKLTERKTRYAQMLLFIGVAPGASKRALAGEFD